jgi:hypothetical protein
MRGFQEKMIQAKRDIKRWVAVPSTLCIQYDRA